MQDERISLRAGYQLKFDPEVIYKIVQEIGRGAGCIVYDAGYTDNLELEHRVRIKECYPCDLKLNRAEDGSLIVLEKDQMAFQKEQEKFKKAYKRNTALGNTLGLINSTVNASNIYSDSNNTIYTVMSYDEGTDYSHIVDKDLKSVFIRIKAVAEIIKKYHSKGFLHLDIKPENIMVIPETKEHVILFDFDSMIAKSELKAENLQLSFSDGFSAPEQVRGEIKKISEATDIYSLGALMFYKIFGRKADNNRDCTLGAKFDFSEMLYADKRYQQTLFLKLEEFLHKTLSISVICRWKKVEQVLQGLDALIRLADFEQLFLYSNFHYNIGHFIGRERELEEIKARLLEHQVVFLHGIGGIGKTELAKRFLHENEGKFNHIIMVSFQESIIDTVIGTDIKIENFEIEENEEKDNYFNRKIETLKSVLSNDDIILLDNFDVSDDEELETLFECPCKFLITTREDFSDYNYSQIDVQEMEEMDDLMELFCTYNSREYKKLEKLCIQELINFVDRHTMTVELLAKYLRDSTETVFDLREKLWKKEGITAAVNTQVRHRKDKKRNSGNISEHLLMLFQLSDFSEKEYELIKSLSLLGYLKINKKLFLDYYRCEERTMEQELQKLIRRGFIEYDELTDKISLHQIILDLVYNYLRPTSESCPAITKAMTRYACMKMTSRVDKDIRKKMLGLFLKRISGSDDTVAEFYLTYCRKIKNENDIVDKVEEICAGLEKEKQHYFLAFTFIQRIKLFIKEKEWFTKEDQKEYFNKFAKRIVDMAEKSAEHIESIKDIEHIRNIVCNESYKVYFYIELGELLNKEGEEIELSVFGEDGSCLDILYAKAQEFLEKAVELMENSDIISEEKIKIYNKLFDFYQDMDFNALYRSEHYGDKEKLLYYSEKIEEERRKQEGKKESNSSKKISYEECGDNAVFQGDNTNAIIYYKKAIEISDHEIEIGWILSKLAKEYKKVKQYEEARDCLLRELMIDEKIGTNIAYTCEDIVDLFIKQNDFSKAVLYCDKAIKYQEQKIEEMKKTQEEENEKDCREYKIWLLVLYAKKYKIVDKEEQEECYRKCMEYYQSEDNADSRTCDFLEIMYRRQLKEQKEQKQKKDLIVIAGKILDIVSDYILEREYQCAERIIFLLIKKEGMELLEGLEEDIEIVVKTLCYCCEIFRNTDREKRALEYCLEAEKKLSISNFHKKQKEQKMDYLSSFVFAKQGRIYYDLGEYEKGDIAKKKCNYYLLAEREEKGKEVEEQIESWQNAAEEYLSIDKFLDAERCFQRLFALLELVFKKNGYRSFENYSGMFRKRIFALLKQGRTEEAYKRITELYLKTVNAYEEKMLLTLEQEEQKRKKEQDRIKGEFCWNLERIAEDYIEASYDEQAIEIYFTRLIVSFGKEIRKDVLKQIVSSDENMKKDMIENVIILLRREDISKELVDIVVDVFGKVEKIEKKRKKQNGYDKWFDRVRKEYKKFAETYQYGEVEFKR